MTNPQARTRWFDRWCYPEMPAERLAALRIVLGGAAVLYLVARSFHLAGVGRHAAWQFTPVGPVALLDSPLPPWFTAAMVPLAIVAGIAFTVGWRWRASGPVFAALFLWVISYRNSWGMLFHTEHLMVLHVGVLALSPAADAWSIDARGRRVPQPSGSYGWAIRLLAAVTVATYLIAGITKLQRSGLEWVTSDTLRNFVAFDNLRKAELGDVYSAVGAAAVRHAWVFPPLAAFSLAIEIGAPLALINDRVGRWWSAAAWSFHAGVAIVMWIVFPYPLLGLAYAPFLRLERGLDAIRTAVTRVTSG